jgi:hypothetical protein
MLSKATLGRILTSDRFCAIFAGRLSPDSMIASGMKAYTLAKENSVADVDDILLALIF